MKNRSGNALVIILLATGLFAALSYAVTQSGRGSANMDREEVILAAGEISNFVSSLRKEVQRLRFMEGCLPENIDWRHNFYRRFSGSLTNSSSTSPVDPKDGCALFVARGGRITPREFSKYQDDAYADYMPTSNTSNFRPGHATLRWFNRKGDGSESNNIGIIFTGIDLAICAYLLNPDNPPELVEDGHNHTTRANEPKPAPFLTPTTQIDEPMNLNNTPFWVNARPMTGSLSYCQLGATLLSL